MALVLVATCFAGCSKSDESEQTTTAAAVTQPEGEIGGALEDGTYKLVGEEGTLTYAVNGNQVTVTDDEDNSRMVFEKAQ